MNELPLHLGPVVIRSSINAVIEKNIARPLDADPATRIEKIEQARKQIGRRLPPNERKRFHDNLTVMDTLKGEYDASRQVVDGAIQTLSTQVPDSDNNPAIKQLKEQTAKQYETFMNLFRTGVYTDFLFATNQKAKIDPYTGLFIRSALMDEIKRTVLDEWLDHPEDVKLGNFEIMALDMENFKVGNIILGHEGFDEFIERMANGFIGMSQYLCANETTSQPYPPAQGDEGKHKEAMDYYFPPRSKEKRLLNMAKTNGILIEFYRDRSGGDEGLVYIKYTGEKNEANQLIAQQLIDTIFSKSKLPKHDENALQSIAETARNFSNNLKINDSTEIRMVRKALGESRRSDYSDKEIGEYINYLNVIADYSRELINTHTITRDPNCRLEMGATFALGDMDQAMAQFLFGMKPDGSYDPDKGLLKLDGEPNVANQAKYINQISSNTRLLEEAMGFEDPQLIDSAIRSEATFPITGNIISRLFQQVERNKKQKKNQTMIDALKGNQVKLYQVAASEQAGRMSGDKAEGQENSNLDVRDRLGILMTIEKYYRTIYEKNKNKELNPLQSHYYQVRYWEGRFEKGVADPGNIKCQKTFDRISADEGVQDHMGQLMAGYV